MTGTYAVIPTKNRYDDLRALLRTLHGQVVAAVIVDNNDEPDEQLANEFDWVLPIHHPGYPPNISELLNVGLDFVAGAWWLHGDEWNVALLNDDVTVPPGWVRSLDAALRTSGAALAYTHPGVTEPRLSSERPASNHTMATGWACLARGELKLRWDEELRWWYSDNAFDLECRQHGGVVAVPGTVPVHHHPSEQTFASAELSAQTHLDEATFLRKYA